VVAATSGAPAVPGAAPPAPPAVVVGVPVPVTAARAKAAGVGDAGLAVTVDGAAPEALSDAEALARAWACLFATEAGYGFHPPGDENRELARVIRPIPGQVALDVTGDADGFTIDGGRLTPVQFAGVLREFIEAGALTVRPGEGIRLVSGGAPEHAATLAATLGLAVYAPLEAVWTAIDGEEIVASPRLVEGVFGPTDRPDGGWHRFGGQ
jgi:hypothetical protein